MIEKIQVAYIEKFYQHCTPLFFLEGGFSHQMRMWGGGAGGFGLFVEAALSLSGLPGID